METKKIKRLTHSERVKIETLIGENRSKSYIARVLNRAPSTIGNEINRWKGSTTFYNADIAHSYAYNIRAAKHNTSKIDDNPLLKLQVYKGLFAKLSPETIAGRLKIIFPDDPAMHISHESIYRHIYEHPQGRINKMLIQCLPCKKHRRRRIKKRDRYKGKITHGISIENRPEHINNRSEAGHWEGDLVIGINQKSCIGTIVERKSRFSLLVKPDNRKSKTVCEAFNKKLMELPEFLRKTMTYDNGTEMAEHKSLSENTGMDIYFAHPYASWERGTNENTNGIIRRFYPKKSTDFNKVTIKELLALQDRLNNRPRKILGFYTPSEVLQYEINKSKGYGDDGGLKMGNKSPKDLFSFLMPKYD